MKHKTSIFIFLYSFVACIAIIWARLFYLQIIQNDYLRQLSTRNFIRIDRINAPRGDIVDRNGWILATNKPVLSLYWQGTGKRKLSDEQKNIILFLAKELDLEDKNGDLFDRITYAEHYEKACLLVLDVPLTQAGTIAERWCAHPNIIMKSTFKRTYPYKNLACHIIGYLTQQEAQTPGKMGLEKFGEPTLRGQPGLRVRLVNAIGKAMQEHETTYGNAGKTLKTTVDRDFQQCAEAAFTPGFDGCLLVMDPRDGALRAVLSRPGFDPELFLSPLSTQAWRELQEHKPFMNRAFDACYPPASLFKLVTAAAALEQGIVSERSCRMCPGFYMYRGRKYHCNKHEGHGLLNFKQAVEYSCNIPFFEIGKKISVDTIANYAHRFGLGRPTGILVPEKNGFFPTSTWKKEKYGERWWQGETLSVAIGQGSDLVTPIQVARMISSIFQSKLVTPRLLESEPVHYEPLAIRPETLSFLRQCLKAVVVEGTGQRVGSLAGFNSYGKTGTAQVCSLEKSSGGQHLREHAWFACYFSYKNYSPLTLVVLVEHAGGSHEPISIARRFMINYRASLEGHAPSTLMARDDQDMMFQETAVEISTTATTAHQICN